MTIDVLATFFIDMLQPRPYTARSEKQVLRHFNIRSKNLIRSHFVDQYNKQEGKE